MVHTCIIVVLCEMIVVVDCNIIVLVMFFWISPNTNIIMIHPNDETKKTPSKIIIFIREKESVRMQHGKYSSVPFRGVTINIVPMFPGL